MDLGMNLKPGINYCAPEKKIGFRGISKKLARLILLAEPRNNTKEIFFFHGVDVPAEHLPYLPSMGPGSSFQNNGCWHHYQIIQGIFIVHLTPNDAIASNFKMEQVLQVIWFEREERPRVFLDKREELLSKGILTPEDLQTIQNLLTEKQLILN